MAWADQSTSLALALFALPPVPNVKHGHSHHKFGRALPVVPGPGSLYLGSHSPNTYFRMCSMFKELTGQLGTSKAKEQATLSGPLSLDSLCERELLKACELGSGTLRAVQWA